jgi:hypothetical protein
MTATKIQFLHGRCKEHRFSMTCGVRCPWVGSPKFVSFRGPGEWGTLTDVPVCCNEAPSETMGEIQIIVTRRSNLDPGIVIHVADISHLFP